MSQKGQLPNKKSLRAGSGKTADWGDLIEDCAAFANATGGSLLIGIEDDRNRSQSIAATALFLWLVPRARTGLIETGTTA